MGETEKIYGARMIQITCTSVYQIQEITRRLILGTVDFAVKRHTDNTAILLLPKDLDRAKVCLAGMTFNINYAGTNATKNRSN